MSEPGAGWFGQDALIELMTGIGLADIGSPVERAFRIAEDFIASSGQRPAAGIQVPSPLARMRTDAIETSRLVSQLLQLLLTNAAISTLGQAPTEDLISIEGLRAGDQHELTVHCHNTTPDPWMPSLDGEITMPTVDSTHRLDFRTEIATDSLASGEACACQISIVVPDDAPAGVYEGALRASDSVGLALRLLIEVT